MHGMLDFPGVLALQRMVTGADDMTAFAQQILPLDTAYSSGALMLRSVGLPYFARPIHLGERPPLFNPLESGTSRAWVNQPAAPASSDPYSRLGLAFAFLMTSPGIPLVNYGDEFGMPGAGTPDNHRFMPADNALTPEQLTLRVRFSALAAVRAAHPCLRRGTRLSFETTATRWLYRMATPGDTVYVALNSAAAAGVLTALPTGTYTDQLTGRQVAGASADVPALSAAIFTKD
jgi:hypothetical protein